MNCGKSWFVDADHTCSRADTTVCRSSYKKQKISHALQRFSSRKGYHQTKITSIFIYYINIGFSFDFIMSCFGTETLQRCNAYLRCEEKNKFVDRLFVERNFFL